MNKNNKNEIIKRNESSHDVQKATKGFIISCFAPSYKELEKPTPMAELCDLPALERINEVIRYNVLSLEYSISPRGGLRHWIKLNISLWLIFVIPLLLFVPLFNYFFSGLVEIFESVSEIAIFLNVAISNIFQVIIYLIFIVAILAALYVLFCKGFLYYRKLGN